MCNKVFVKCNRNQKIIYNKKKNIRIKSGATGKALVRKYLVSLILFYWPENTYC